MSHKKRPKRKMSTIQWSPKKLRRMLLIIALLIIPPFVLWGVSSAVRSERQYKIGKIGRQTIIMPIWQRAYMHTKAEMFMRAGRNPDPDQLKPMVWERLMLLYDAKKRHIKVTDDDVAKEIGKYNFLKNPDGSISMQAYSSFTHKIGLNEKEFEELTREDLILRKLFESITSGISVTEEELKQAFRDKEEKVDFLYGKILQKDFLPQVDATDEEIKQYYDGHKDKYLKPVSIKVKYVRISVPEIRKKIAVEKPEIEKYFNEHPSEFTGKNLKDVEEQIYTKLEKKAAEKRFDEIVKWISRHKIKDISVLASRYGLEIKETPFYSSMQIMPDLGWVPAFYTDAFSMEKGQVSKPIRMKDTYYIFQVMEKKEAYIPELEEIRDIVIKDVKGAKAKEKAKGKAEAVKKEIVDKIASQQGKPPEDIFKEVFPDAREAKDISRGSYVPGMGIAKAFFGKLLKADPVSDPIEARDGYVIALKTKYVKPDDKQFQKEKEKLKEDLLFQKKDKAFNAYVRELYNKVQITIYKDNY